MKKIFLMLLSVITLAAFSQSKNLSTVNTVKPKKGQKMAFETAYKAHTAKFHKGDERISVYEILSGDHAGFYHLVNSGRSFADLDNQRSDATVHNLDLDKNFFPLLEETKNGYYRYMDSLSFRPEVEAEAFIVNVTHLKQGLNENDYRREQARTVKVGLQLSGPFWKNFSYTIHEQLWDGSESIVVQIRSLKDGFKSLEQGFYGPPQPGLANFRDVYIKDYGYDAWEERQKIMDGAVVKRENYIMRLRKDLGSQ